MFKIVRDDITPALERLARRAAALPKKITVTAKSQSQAYARVASLGRLNPPPKIFAALGFKCIGRPPGHGSSHKPNSSSYDTQRKDRPAAP